MKLIPLPASQDGCLWLLHDGQSILVKQAVTHFPNFALATKRQSNDLVHYAIRLPENEFR
jgi:hypothetical protein